MGLMSELCSGARRAGAVRFGSVRCAALRCGHVREWSVFIGTCSSSVAGRSGVNVSFHLHSKLQLVSHDHSTKIIHLHMKLYALLPQPWCLGARSALMTSP